MDYKRNTFLDNNMLLELWFKAKEGDKKAFSELAGLLYRVLASFATKFTKDKELIKDVIQDLYLKLWENRTEINIKYVKIYYINALRNTLLNKFREGEFKINKVEIDDAFDISDGSNIEYDLITDNIIFESAQKINKAILNLPPRQKQALLLKFYSGFDNDKISEIMNVNKQSISNLIYKAILELKNDFIMKSSLLLAIILEHPGLSLRA